MWRRKGRPVACRCAGLRLLSAECAGAGSQPEPGGTGHSVSGTGCRKPRAWLVCTITVDNSQVWSSLNVHSQETTSSQLKKQQTHPPPPPRADEVLCCLPPVTERLGLSREVTSWALPLPEARATRVLLKPSELLEKLGVGRCGHWRRHSHAGFLLRPFTKVPVQLHGMGQNLSPSTRLTLGAWVLDTRFSLHITSS